MATFNYTTFLNMVLDRIQAKSVFLPLINNTADTTISGVVGDGIRVRVDPLTKVTVRTNTQTPVTAALPDFIVDRVVSDYTNVTLNDIIYAGFIANGIDTIDFSDAQGSNYADWVAQIADQIAAYIDTLVPAALQNGTTGAPNTAVSVASGTRDEVALTVLDAIQAQVDDLDANGVPGPYVIVANPAVGRKVSPLLEKYAFTGDSANTALRQNIIGELYGAPTVKSAKVAANTVLVFSKDAAIVASRPTGKSSGATKSATVKSSDGTLALTANLGFDTTKQADVVVVSTVAKVGVLDKTRARKITFTFA